MKRWIPWIVLLSLQGHLTSCTTTRAVAQTNIPANRSRPVEATVSKFIILGFNFDNDFVLNLSSNLAQRCPRGSVRGVTTQDTVTLYFLYILWSRTVTARGYCLPYKTTAELEADGDPFTMSQE